MADADAAVTSQLRSKSEFKQLQHELQLLKNSLQNVDTRQEKRVIGMMRQIRQLIYEAEDSIDYCFMQSAAPVNKMNIFRRRRGVAKELSSFRKGRLTATIRKARIAIDNEVRSGAHGSGMRVEQQQTIEKEVPSIKLLDSIVGLEDEKIVGREDEETRLTDYLMEPTEELDVVSIIGMPGIGKTTLARKIYQNEEIKDKFPIRIWVCVSHDFSKREVLLSILKQLTKQDKSDHLTDYELAHKVSDFLANKKFLLVLDDVWSTDVFSAIEHVLPKEKYKMGKVLITSRFEDVGRLASATRPPQNLRFLTMDQSLVLLQLEAFGKLDNCPEQLIPVGQQIVKECRGLPLAIKTVAGILAVRSLEGKSIELAEHLWYKVSENVTKYIQDYTQEPVSETLEMSYNKLSIQLRDCFLYLGMFPENYEISVRTLTHLWIAEGFIGFDERQSLEDKAAENLSELVKSNLVMVDEIYSHDKVKTCRVHDLVHGFCKSKAAEHNFFKEIKMSEEGISATPISPTQNCYRLCIHSHLSEFLSRKPQGPRVRSFLCFNKDEKTAPLNPKQISAIHKSFNLLRVFKSTSVKFTKFPKKLTKLMHLRYISLSSDHLDILPEAISELWNLQTLVINTRLPSLVIKANIWRMIQLRHLITKAAIILARQGKGAEASENLQTLSRLSPKYCTKEVFERAPNLKELGIRGNLATDLDFNSLKKLDHLENLKLVNDLFDESGSDDNQLHSCLHPNYLSPNLTMLTLSATYLDWKHMSILGKIETLKSLKLKNNAFTGESWNSTDVDGFGCLEFLFIGNTDLVSWEASSADCFPRLNRLVLRNCEKLKEIPLCLAKSLKILDIDHVSRSVVVSARKIEEEAVRMRGRFRESLRLYVGPGCE